MGDPETQVVLPRIENDFLEIMLAIENQTLDKINLKINPDQPDNDIGPMAAFSLITPTKNCQEQKHLNDAPGGQL